MSIVEVRGLCKAFGDNQVLKNLDFQIEKGEVVTLIGPSGGGKTTLLRSLNWLNVPDAGRVTIDGVTIEAGKENKQQIRALREKTSMVFQHYNLWKNKTALENITGRTDSGSEDAESPGSGESRTFAGTCRTDREER